MSAPGSLPLAQLARAVEALGAAYPDPVLLIALDGTVIGASEPMVRQSGIDRERLLGSHFLQWALPEDRSMIADQFAAAVQGAVRRFRTSARADAIPRRASVTYTPVLDDGDVTAVLMTAFSIDQMEEREREYAEADSLLRIAGDLASFGGFSIDRATESVRLSSQARAVLSLDKDQTLDVVDTLELFAPLNREEVVSAIEQCFEHGTPIAFQSQIRNGEGVRQFVRVVAEAVRDRQGAITGIHGALWDITDAVEGFEREAELRARLDETLDSIEDGFLFVDEAWRIVYANRRTELLAGIPFAEFEGHNLWEAFPQLADTELELAYQRAVRDRVRTTTRQFHAPSARWIDATAYPTRTGLALYFRDVTEDELTRQKVSIAQRRIAEQAELIDAVNDAIIVRGLDGVVRHWNRAAETIYGIPAEEAIGQEIGDLLGIAFAHYDAITLREGYYAEEVPHRTEDGRSLVLDCRWQLLRADDGTPDAILSVDTDVTEWRRDEDLRARASRMESLGTFAGGIAHDLNNVLTPILMSTQMLRSMEQDPSRRELLDTMEAAAHRGADMIRQVLSFARGVDGRRERVAVEQLLEEIRRFAGEMLPAEIRLEIEVEDELPDVLGDSTQLLQVLSNLVTNARDAMPRGGRLDLSASLLHLADRLSAESYRVPPGEYLLIDVVDSGVGMPAHVVEKIFEPFYTTKSVGKGTGLGLASSLAIVRSHGGALRVYSELGRGTRFSMLLPAVARTDRTPARATPSARPISRGRGELVLVVDDDQPIRTIAARTLEEHGYRVLTAGHGREALTIIDDLGGRLDLVLTDMMMPVMDGAATTAELEQRYPHLPVIAASGLTSEGGAERSAGMGVAAFLPKPYTTELLLSTVRVVLDHAQAPAHHNPESSAGSRGADG